MTAPVTPAYAEAARRATRLALHDLKDARRQSLALSNLYGAIELEAAYGQSAPLDARLDALTRALALIIHAASKNKGERERRRRDAERQLGLCLQILARDASLHASAAISIKITTPEEGAGQ